MRVTHSRVGSQLGQGTSHTNLMSLLPPSWHAAGGGTSWGLGLFLLGLPSPSSLQPSLLGEWLESLLHLPTPTWASATSASGPCARLCQLLLPLTPLPCACGRQGRARGKTDITRSSQSSLQRRLSPALGQQHLVAALPQPSHLVQVPLVSERLMLRLPALAILPSMKPLNSWSCSERPSASGFLGLEASSSGPADALSYRQ